MPAYNIMNYFIKAFHKQQKITAMLCAFIKHKNALVQKLCIWPISIVVLEAC